MNNCRTRKLNQLIWIGSQAYWVYQCLMCQKVELEKHQAYNWGGFHD